MNGPGEPVPTALPIGVPALPQATSTQLPRTGARSENTAPKDSSSKHAVNRRAERRRGPGVAGLSELNRLLSARDITVLQTVSSHRFLTTAHVEQFVFVDHASASSAARVCRRVLKRLEEQRLLQRPLRRIGGLTAGSASSVWLISSRGLHLLNLRAGIGAVGRVREPGERFVQHYLAVADAHLALRAADRTGQLQLVELELEPVCWRRFTGLSGGRETLKPDLFAVTAPASESGGSAYEDLWFIEVDRGTESLPTLLRQCRAYESYRSRGIEQAQHGAFPRVAWVMPDEVRAAKLTAALAAARELDDELYRVTTLAGFLPLVLGGAG